MHLKVEMYSAGQYTLCHENNKNLVKSGIKFYRLNCEDNPNVSIHCMLFPYGYTTFLSLITSSSPKSHKHGFDEMLYSTSRCNFYEYSCITKNAIS